MDSGAAESVIPPMELPGHPVIQNAASLSGDEYLTADGKTIPNTGEQKVSFRTQEGHRCARTFQVTDVTKPLLSATQLAGTGHEVIFRKIESQWKQRVADRGSTTSHYFVAGIMTASQQYMAMTSCAQPNGAMR